MTAAGMFAPNFWSVWTMVGLAGVALFSSRWLVQVLASRRAGRSVINGTFWAMSASGSLLLLGYFALGPNRNLIGVLSNLFPLAVAAYNLRLLLWRKRGARESMRQTA